MLWLKSLAFLLAAPGTVCGLVPWMLVRWVPFPAFRGSPIGLAMLALGGGALLWCFADFVRSGRGTANPAVPPKKLVVAGLYRFSRNPMYVAVITVLIGEALWFGRPVLFAWAAVAVAVFHLFIVCYEEAVLRKTFGSEFDAYCGRVRRWI